jgi:integrase
VTPTLNSPSWLSDVAKGNTARGAETMGELLDRWLEHGERVKGWSPTTVRSNRHVVEGKIRPALGKIRLSKLTARHLDQLYADLRAKGNAPSTVRLVHALIRSALHQAERWDLVDRNVANRANPPAAAAPYIKVPSPEQVQGLTDAAYELALAEGNRHPELATLVPIAALIGARAGEICALRWTDLDWNARTLTIARSVYAVSGGGWAEKAPKTRSGRRTLALDHTALAWLTLRHEQAQDLAQEHGAKLFEEGFVFAGEVDGSAPTRPDFLSKWFADLADLAGVDVTLHSLRHYAATQSVAANIDIRTIANRLGHAAVGFTLQTYAAPVTERDRELAEALGQTLALPVGS